MDPNIMKFLEEDENEKMHSWADVDALAAELSRDIEGNNSTPQQPSVSNACQHSCELELQRHGSDPQNGIEDDNSSHEPNPSTGKGNQQNEQASKEQVMPPLNQHTTGMAMTSRISNPQSMTTSTQQLKLNSQLPLRMLVRIIRPQLDKDRAMQLTTHFANLKKKEISKDDFILNLRSIVGDQMLRTVLTKLQIQAAKNSGTATNQFQSQPQTSRRQMQVSSAQLPTDLSNSMGDNNAAKLCEVEMQAVSHGAQVGQMSTSSSGALCHEWKHPAFSTQGLNTQQNMQFLQISFPTYGSAGSSYQPFPTTSAASSAAIRPQPYDSQTRHAPSHPNLVVNHLGTASRPMNATNIATFDRPHSLSDPKKMPTGSLTHVNRNAALQQNQVQCSQSTSKEHRTSISPSMIHVQQEPSDQPNEHKKSKMSPSRGLSSLPTAPSKLGSVAPWNLKDESFEIQSRTGLTLPTTLVPLSSVPSPRPSLMETNILSSSRMPPLTTPLGPANNSKAPPKRPLVGQKKPMEAPGSSPPSSKKQKVSGSFVDQSIEYLNDVTAVSGVNIMKEEELLFSGAKEDIRVSEASQMVIQEEEQRLIFQNVPLKKIMVEKMAKCGLKSMSNDMERCLSLCVEERMSGLISNVIRHSKQRVNMEKPRHETIITSDVRQQIMALNRKAHEEWEKLNEPESSTGTDVDKEKDESRGKSTKLNKEDDDKMRTAAANVAVRAATGVGDITSRWQLMIEAKQKQGGFDTSSGPQTNINVGRKTLATSTRNRMENHKSEKRDPSFSLTIPASVRKVGRNQVVVPRVARSISVRDVIAVLEREPQLSKSMLLYGLYQKVKGDTVNK